jgi:hypothetical protein
MLLIVSFYEKLFWSAVHYCRYDWLAKKSLVSGYFLWAMFAYGFGENQLIDSIVVFFQTNYVVTKKLRYICMMVDWLGFFLILVGLLITYVALNLMDRHGQPALLYIVPFTLGSFYEKDHYFIIIFLSRKNIEAI